MIRARGAQSQLHGNLPPPRAGPKQKKVRDVAAGYQEQQHNRGKQESQKTAEAGPVTGIEPDSREHGDAPSGIGIRVGLLQPSSYRSQLRLSPLERNARLEPAEQA